MPPSHRALRTGTRGPAARPPSRRTVCNACGPCRRARRALDARDWATAVAECRQALALAPGHELASALLAEAEQSIGREQRRIALVTHADRTRFAGHRPSGIRFAEAALKDADVMAPGSTPVRDLRRQLVADVVRPKPPSSSVS